MDSNEILDYIELKLNESKDIIKAKSMKSYMKDHYDYLGLTAPVRKEIFKKLWSDHKNTIVDNWPTLVTKLWGMDFREYQYVAMDIIRKIEKRLTTNDLPLIEKLILSKSWWDTVDFLASHGVGHILKNNRQLQLLTAERYINSDDMWLRRTALIFQLFYKKDTDAELLTALIDHTLGSKEFFINKAAGWALRQYSRTDPHFVAEYIDLQRDQLAPLTLREGSKYL
jgi:3-methyladenine DNA glycosylase AlkD